MKKLNKNTGITLISLVITIIIMLILVGVSITLAVNGGLFEYAGNAVGDTKNAIKNEQGLIDDIIENYIKTNVPGEGEKDGIIEIPEKLKVGDYVNYTPTTGTYEVTATVSGHDTTQFFTTETGESELQWRVWSIDKEKGTIELISATAAQATETLYLFGAEGYNHAVDILNDMCKALYSNEKGATARSINVEDINAKTKYKVEEDTSFNDKYGNKETPNWNSYPSIYAKELGSTENGLEETRDLLTGSEGVRNSDGTADYNTYTGSNYKSTLYATYTYYKYKPEDYLNNELGINTASADLINLGTAYWLASRFVICDSSSANFGLRIMSENVEGGLSVLFCSKPAEAPGNLACRPVVSLNSNVSLTVDESKKGDGVTYWDIEFLG